MSFQDSADRGVKSKAGAVALALFRYRCISASAGDLVLLFQQVLY